MPIENRLDSNGVLYLTMKYLLLFQRQESGKGLSANDFTDALKTSLENLRDNTANYQTYTQVSTAISAALEGYITEAEVNAALANYSTAAQVTAEISAALQTIDTEIFVVVATLPDAVDALPNKIYIVAGDQTEWFVKDGEWEQVGEASVSLEGYFNTTNLVPITNAEIDSILAGLV
jgi:hypothetical protein